MDNLQIFKEKMINDYLSSIDISETSIDQIKQDLRSILGEEPAVKLNYVINNLIIEGTNDKKKIENIESISIIFTIDKEIVPGHNIPFPITKTFLIN